MAKVERQEQLMIDDEVIMIGAGMAGIYRNLLVAGPRSRRNDANQPDVVLTPLHCSKP